jgi:N-acetylmuramoyl-L-alanine amidase
VVRGGGGQVLYEDLGALVPGAVAASTEESLALVRWDAAGAEYGFESQRLAQNVAAKLKSAFRRDRPSVMRRPVWNLEGANMPAVLIELTAPGGDADQALGKGETLESLAKAVASGIVSYWSGERPESEDGG